MRSDVIAYGHKAENGDFPVFYADGTLWFTIDGVTGKEKIEPAEPFDYEAHVAFLHECADTSNARGLCYFIGGDLGFIKIGYSIDVKTRLRTLQLSSPIPLRVLATAPGGIDRETAYHAQFDEVRQHGEWFERAPELLDEIARLSATPEAVR